MTEDRLAVALLGTFESLRMGPTFARGRRDERAGHVRSLTVSSSIVIAQVRGPDDPRAIRSRIAVRAFGASEWARIEGLLAGQARYAADLLAGRMPAGVGTVFAEAGLGLVPLSLDEVAMDCTCERWPMPCVHLAATLYALGRRISEDPFTAFAWRGRSRDELLTHLRELRAAMAVEGRLTGSTGPASRGGSGPGGSGPGGSGSGGSGPGGSGPGGSGPGGSGSAGSGPGGWGPGGSGPGGHGTSGSGPDGRESGGSISGGASDEAGDDGSAAGLGEGLGEPADFWGADAPPVAGPVSGRPGAAGRPDALLDQLDPPPLAQDGRPLVELLRPAYQALPDE